MDIEELQREIQSLKRKIQRLSREIRALKTFSIEDPSPVERLLKTRGLKIFRKNPTDGLFFPPDLAPVHRRHLYETMKKYSFRLVLRDMVKYREGFDVGDLTHYCSAKVVRGYCSLLVEMGVITNEGGDRYRPLVSPLYSFGPTLEWFVAEMFKREFASPALYGASLKKTASGGDYDVITAWSRRLVYVEVKSSPPKGIEIGEISTFLSRIEDLLPDVSIFYNDTQLRMKDKLVVMFEEELGRRCGKKTISPCPVERLIDELFHVRHRIYIANSSRKDVVGNFHLCLKDYLQHGGGSEEVAKLRR
jgi:hypothetical protein